MFRTRRFAPALLRCRGFGLIDTLIALSLLAVSLLGISGGVHYALRATHATLLQTQAVDLIADLAEDLHSVKVPGEVSALLADWQLRVRRTLPARDFEPPRLTRVSLNPGAPDALAWFDVQLEWNNLRGMHDGSLSLPVTSPGAGTMP